MRRAVTLLAALLWVGGLVGGQARADEEATYRLEAQRHWLFGRPDLLESHLPLGPDDVGLHLGPEEGLDTAIDVWPYLLRDLWWRPADEATRWRRREVLAWALGVVEAAAPQLKGPYRWLRDGGDAPYPAPAVEADPWLVLSTLVLDRQRRETQGAEGYPEESPLATRPPPEDWMDWWPDWFAGYQQMTVRRGLEGDDVSSWPEEERAMEVALDEKAERLHARNKTLAVVAVLAFLVLAVVLAWRVRPRADVR